MPKNNDSSMLGDSPNVGLDKSNFLDAGHLMGINTVGTCNKNGPQGAAMIRGEPSIPVGPPPPSNISTIENCSVNKGICG
jgi:hypothetical protein